MEKRIVVHNNNNTDNEGRRQSTPNAAGNHCVHRLQAKKSWQGFTSPNFPKGITTQTQCSWIISAIPPRRVKVSFKTLNLTGSVNNCFTQFVEIWEIRSASSMGKFCGDRRPGDFVSYGSQVRVDLKADTAAAVHAGFEIQYRFTREAGGFKRTNSFWTKQSKSKKLKPVVAGKTKFLSTGGRINLKRRKKLRETASRVKKVSRKPKIKKTPIQAVRKNRRKQPPPTKPPVYQPKKNLMVTLKNGEEESGIKLWIIIVIGVGGGLFLIVIGVISYLCFCHKRKNKNSTNQNHFQYQNNNQGYSAHHRQYGLPGEETGYHQDQNSFELRSGNNGYYNSKNQTPLRRAPKYKRPTSITNDSSGKDDEIKKNKTVNENEQRIDENYDNNYRAGLSAKEQKMLKHLSSDISEDAASSSSVDDEGYETSKVHKTKQLPTMKRELSEWEKNELNRIKRKM